MRSAIAWRATTLAPIAMYASPWISSNSAKPRASSACIGSFSTSLRLIGDRDTNWVLSSSVHRFARNRQRDALVQFGILGQPVFFRASYFVAVKAHTDT